MSEASATDLTPPAAADAAPAAEAAPAPVVVGAGESPPVEGQGEGQGADTGTGAETGTASAEGEAPEGAEGADALGATEYTAFTLPEGMELAGDMLEGLTSLAKAHNLDQAGAQALVDLGVQQAQAITDRFVEQVSKTPVPLSDHWALEWSKQTTADPALGGDKLATTMALATRVFQTFATPELGQFFRETGLAHHPELIRFMNKVGAAVSEDTLVTPQGGNQQQQQRGRDTAKKLYPGMA